MPGSRRRAERRDRRPPPRPTPPGVRAARHHRPEDRKVVDGHGHPGDLDLVLHFAVCRRLDPDVFAEVPRPLVLNQVADELAWAAEHNPTEYAVLNACRAWRYTVDGSLVSKVDGGHWAETRLAGPDLALVRAALARRGEAAPDLTPTSSGLPRVDRESYDSWRSGSIRMTLSDHLTFRRARSSYW